MTMKIIKWVSLLGWRKLTKHNIKSYIKWILGFEIIQGAYYTGKRDVMTRIPNPILKEFDIEDKANYIWSLIMKFWYGDHWLIIYSYIQKISNYLGWSYKIVSIILLITFLLLLYKLILKPILTLILTIKHKKEEREFMEKKYKISMRNIEEAERMEDKEKELEYYIENYEKTKNELTETKKRWAVTKRELTHALKDTDLLLKEINILKKKR